MTEANTDSPPVCWIDEETDLDCCARINHFGIWLGYVKVPEGHPWNGKDYHDLNLDIHGGLTFSGTLERLEGFWLGFDCFHPGDIMPVFNDQFPGNMSGDTYKDFKFVKIECKKLAQAVHAFQGLATISQ